MVKNNQESHSPNNSENPMDAIIHKTIEGLIAFICLAPFALAFYAAVFVVIAALFAPPQD